MNAQPGRNMRPSSTRVQVRGDGSHRFLGDSDVYAESPLKAVLQVVAGEMSSD